MDVDPVRGHFWIWMSILFVGTSLDMEVDHVCRHFWTWMLILFLGISGHGC
jgi:hypothetical protein